MSITKFIPNAVTRKVMRQVLIAKKNSPHIFFVAGVAGVVTSTVLACRATLKLSDTVDELAIEVSVVKDMEASLPEEEYSKRNYHKDMAQVYGTATFEIAKLYGPAVILGGLSIAALTGSHVALTRRNAALTAAYATLHSAYEAYRERIVQEVGPERELDLYHGAITEKVKTEEGKTELVKVVDPNKMSPYARFFDEFSPNWTKNAEYNKIFVQCQQEYFNQLLQVRGHVFLNEVYDALGIPRTSAGQVVGWTTMVGNGDGYIDFGIFEARNARFVEAWERSVLLDFNVDGVIFKLIGREK